MTEYLRTCMRRDLDRWAPIFDELTVWSARFGLILLDQLEIRPGIVGIDLGCGTGFPLIELAQLHGPSSRFTGIDPWEAACDVVREKIAFHQLKHVDVHVGSADALPFDAQSVDLITSNLGINNFADPGGSLREAHRVARPGARLALTTNPIGTMPEIYAAIREALQITAPGSVRDLDSQERHRGTPASLEALVAGAGFEVTQSIGSSFEMRFADAAALLRHPLVGCFLEGWLAVLPEEAHVAIFLELEQVLARKAASDGYLRTSVRCHFLEAIAR